MAIISSLDRDVIKLASQKLLDGNLVAIPTETVYGLAALITIEDAVKEIYKIKGRPSNHPLIMHIAKLDDLYKYSVNVPKYVEILAKYFWPGPLTFILKKSDKTPNYITGNQDTVAIRMPANNLTLRLIKNLNIPLVAPSANKFMGISPTRAEHVFNEFGSLIDIIDDGPCNFGIESTIIDATNIDNFKILRPGAITREEIYLKTGLNFDTNKKTLDLKYPGNHKKHYSPRKRLFSFKTIDELEFILKENNNSVCVIMYSTNYDIKATRILNINSLPRAFAKEFYHLLRIADEDKNTNVIAIEEPPHGNDWESIWDRLVKAKYTE